MLIFHEGLPGSGKTYEAMVKHILPALSDGRLVVTNVDGLGEIDYLSSISQLVNQPLSHVQKNIVFLDKDQVSKINLYVPDNALVVIDELQNYFPSGRERLSPDIVSWVSEHRHLGIDVVVISQDIKEVHNLFRRRVDRKICFLKLDALGVKSRYQWSLFKSVGDAKFEKVSSGIEVYQPKYFSVYKSHASQEVSTSLYVDRRAVFWNSLKVRFIFVFFLLGVIFFPYYLYRQFRSESSHIVDSSRFSSSPGQTSLSKSVSESDQIKNRILSSPAPAPAPVSAPAPAPALALAPVVSSSRSHGMEYVGYLSDAYRIRLSSVIRSAAGDQVVVEWRDEGGKLLDRLDQSTLLYLGWSVTVISLTLVKLTKGDRSLVVTPWPLQIDDPSSSDSASS